MSNAVNSGNLGEQLYRLLPEVYRTRDKKTGQADNENGAGDLKKYLDAHGYLLDLIHASLEQQLRDTLPESCQDWLLPYFAQLLAANIVSPDFKGKHAEIANAVSWRQRKGTLKCAEEIAEAVGQMEVEIQEGWKRVAITPRIGMPLIPAKAWDSTLDKIDMNVPSRAAQHPGLPAVTVDLRYASRAVEAAATNPAARSTNFGGVRQTWRQANPHGVPCFPDRFDDVSRRTVDLRSPDSTMGHYHHKRLLAYAPPPAGLFPFDPIQLDWDKRDDSLYTHLIDEKSENGVSVIRNKTDRIIEITCDHEIILASYEPASYRIEGLNFKTKLSVSDGSRLELHSVEAMEVEVNTFSIDGPVMTAKDCLFNKLSVGKGTASLDSCTILTESYLSDIEAVDCIFTGTVKGTLISGYVQYSRIPVGFPFDPDKMTVKSCTTVSPELFAYSISYTGSTKDNNGAGVLRPDCAPSIYTGASDGGEMGYFHNGRKERPVYIECDQTLLIPDGGEYPLKDIIFKNSIEADVGGQKLVMIRSAAKSLKVNALLSYDNNDNVIPSLDAMDCLFDDLEVNNGLVRLEYCTAMKETKCTYIQASDCIFAETITGVEDDQPPFLFNCIRYSGIPSDPVSQIIKKLRLVDTQDQLRPGSNTMEAPVFIQFDYCNSNYVHEKRAAVFGEPGYGVLDWGAPDAIRFGAEDGGEMGACHHKYYSLKAMAVIEKMKEFLPVGIEPVLIQDTRLLQVPPEQSK